MRYVGITFRGGTNPNLNSLEAWVTKNPYAQAGLYGQCTWFAWGRFYELYGYDPGFSGDGSSCVKELVAAINVNLKMYSFDHLRMYNIDHINTCCSRW